MAVETMCFELRIHVSRAAYAERGRTWAVRGKQSRLIHLLDVYLFEHLMTPFREVAMSLFEGPSGLGPASRSCGYPAAEPETPKAAPGFPGRPSERCESSSKGSA